MNLRASSLNSSQLLAVLALSRHPTAIYSGEQLIIESANDAMCKIWELSRDVEGVSLEQAVPKLSDHVFSQLIRKAWSSGLPQEAKNVPLEFSGADDSEWRYYDIDYQPVKDAEGKVFCVLQTAVDVTSMQAARVAAMPHTGAGVDAVWAGADARSESRANIKDGQPDRHSVDGSKSRWLDKFLEQEHSENERDRIRRFFMQAPAGICVLDGPDFVFEIVNPRYQQLFPRRELLGKPVLDALPELKDSDIATILRNVYETGETFEARERMVPLSYDADGPVQERYFDFIYQARLNHDGLIDGILVFVIEVTDTVLNRKKIEENEASLGSLVMKSHYGLMILRGRDYVIEIVNQQIANLWQKALPEITGKKLLDVLPEIIDQPFPALLERVYNTGESYGQEQEVLYIGSGEEQIKKFVSFYYDPMIDSEGKVNGIIVACEDITEKVQSARLLQESYEKQQASNEELSSLNEELAAMNEEMAATNEELMATNDELIEAQASLQRMIAVYEESENKIRALVASAPFPIGVYEGREMEIVLANKAIMDVWGKGYDVLGKRYAELLPELENQEIFEQLDQVYTTGVPFHARSQRVDLMIDGKMQIFYFNYSFTPLHDKSGRIYGVMNTASDVTDLTLTKQRIEQNERNLNNLIVQSPVAMCFLAGPQHVITVANPMMLEIWGKPLEEVMNKPVFEALPDAREQGLEQIMWDVYHNGKTFRANEMPVSLIRNGKLDVVYQNFVYEPYRDPDGLVVGVIATTVNVTEQVEARKKIEQNEAELLEIKKRLEAELEAGKEIQRQKDSFIGIASHELKTPLTSLTAIIQVANVKLSGNEDAFLSGAMEKAQLQVKRMRAMINGFLNISRLESGNMHIEKQDFDMNELMEEVIEEVNITSSSHGIRYQGCGVLNIRADRDKISSVVSNLLTNAIKYSPVATEVVVSVAREDKILKVCVEDKGIGIRPEDQERVFERYYRVETEHTQHISGFGIGLYLSAEIVRRHGGEIWVESEPGNGSRFSFILPIA